MGQRLFRTGTETKKLQPEAPEKKFRAGQIIPHQRVADFSRDEGLVQAEPMERGSW